MNLNKLYNIAEREDIDVYNFKMDKTKARIIEYQGIHIFMDYSQIDTSYEEKCLVAEELRSLFLSCILFPIFFANISRQARI